MRNGLRVALGVAGLALFLLAFASPALAQGLVPPQESKPQPERYLAVDQIAIESFTSEPATIPAGTTQVILRVKVKNMTSGPSAVVLNGIKVRILRTKPQPDVLELETTVVNLGAGLSQSMGAHVNIAPGTREYLAQVDWDNTLHEAALHQLNNSKTLVLTIPKSPVRP